MFSKISLFFLITLGTLSAKSQTLLNADSVQIKKQMLLQGGVLMRSFRENGFEMPGYYHKMIFGFRKPTNEDNGVYSMEFCLTLKNRCFKYYVSYYGDISIPKLLKKFNNPSSGLKQTNESLKWVNRDEKYEMRILPRMPVNGKLAPVYILEIKNE